LKKVLAVVVSGVALAGAAFLGAVQLKYPALPLPSGFDCELV
jgi:hypothetical protein